MEIFNPNSNINFLRLGKFTVGLAIALVLGSLILIFTRGLNYGLDFTGGVVVEVAYNESVDVAQVRKALDTAGFENAVVQTMGGTHDISIRLQPKATEEHAAKVATDDAGEQEQAAQTVNVDHIASDVVQALSADGSKVHIKQQSFVGPEVGASLRTEGIYATVFVIIGIMGYLWIRFERRFAIAAFVTEIHDAVVTVGVFALVQRQFDLTVLASVMAVVGYSINDKVVVFDRVRELFRLARKAEPQDILNRAINTTLSRTIMTSLLTAISMLALYVFGGPVVHGFAITMLIGIIVGTLSSIFIASPILLWLGVSKRDLMPRTRDNPELARRP